MGRIDIKFSLVTGSWLQNVIVRSKVKRSRSQLGTQLQNASCTKQFRHGRNGTVRRSLLHVVTVLVIDNAPAVVSSHYAVVTREIKH